MPLAYRYLDPEKIIASDDFKVVEAFLRGTKRTNIGWHYAVDLTWIYSRARRWPRGARVLDAGGGRGPAQFLLAEMGFDVTNVDLVHTEPDHAFRRRYATRRETLGSHAETPYADHVRSFGGYWRLLKRARRALGQLPVLREAAAAAYAARHDRWRRATGADSSPVGSIRWLAGNVRSLPELNDGQFEAVVSLSSLEHVPLEDLPGTLAEIRRVVRAGGPWAITTSATDRPRTWYHAPSRGHCFSATDLDALFEARPADATRPADVLRQYEQSRYLRKNLAVHYRLSGNNGMPWGRWNPVYVPVALSEDTEPPAP